MRALFTRFYRCEAISRCIGLVRRTKIIFLPTRCMSRFWLTSGVRATGSAQKRHLEAFCERLSSDPSTSNARTPSIPSHHGHFPIFRPATTPPHDTTRERHYVIRTRKSSAGISRNAIARSTWRMRSIVIAIPWCRWPPTMELPMALRASPMGQNHVNIQKVDKMVGKNFILVLLTTLVCMVNHKHHFIRP